MLKDRLWSILGFCLATLYVAGPSKVPLDLWIASGGVADVVVLGWMIALGALIIEPSCVRLHYATAFLGVVVFGGRGGGFLELAANGRAELITAVAERFVLAGWTALWHWRAIRMIDLRRLVDLYQAYLWTHPGDSGE